MRAYRCDRCNGPLVGHFTCAVDYFVRSQNTELRVAGSITCGHTMCRACVLHQVMLRKAQCPFCPMQKLWGKGLCYPLKTVREWIDGVRGRNRPDIVLGQETIKRLHANERLVAYDRRYQRDAVAGRTAATAIDVDGMLPSRPVRRAVLSLQRA